MGSNAPVAVLGGGIAGLVAARELQRRRVPFTLFEASARLAGLSASERDPEGFAYDIGAHFVTNRLAAAVGIGAECRTVAHYGETVVLDGKAASYPFGLLRRPAFAAGALAARARGGADANADVASWFRKTYGQPLADRVAIPLLEAWSGAPADELAASVSANIPSSVARTVFLKAAARLTHRAVGLGYSHEAPEGPSVFHVYPEAGVGRLADALAAPLAGHVHLETPVTSMSIEDGRVRSVTAGGNEVEVSAVVSTAPVNVLGKLTAGAPQLYGLEAFRYRPMVFVNLRFFGRGLLPDVVTWTPEEHFPFFRLTEAPVSMPMQAPAGKTTITADLGCEVGDAVWAEDDEVLAERCLDAVRRIIPDARHRYLGARVLRTKLAYPVYLRSYEERRRLWDAGSGIDNLLSVGRNGEFAHLLTEDVYWRTCRKVAALVDAM